jgi:hypothetical protein
MHLSSHQLRQTCRRTTDPEVRIFISFPVLFAFQSPLSAAFAITHAHLYSSTVLNLRNSPPSALAARPLQDTPSTEMNCSPGWFDVPGS